MMRKRIHFPSSVILRKLAGSALILLVIIGAFLLYLGLRGYGATVPLSPFSFADLFRFELHQLDVGTYLQLIVVPVLLMYLLSLIPPLRRLLQGQTIAHGTLSMFCALAAVQLISQSYEIYVFGIVVNQFYMGFLVILIGSLLGGWRVGIPLGCLSLMFQSFYELVSMPPILADLGRLGLRGFIGGIDWGPFLFSHFFHPHFSSAVWMAVLACMGAGLLGRQRYSPTAAAVLGMLLVYTAASLRLAAGPTADVFTSTAQALITGLAAAWVMLMVRYLQVELSQRKAAAAELARTQAELRALRAQINPHFFFNALNTIRFMIREDPPAARALLIDLSEVFQRTLRSGEFVPLRDELGYVRAYLSLEKARLGGRLRIVWGGLLKPEEPLETETPLLGQPVPTLTLQPLVENAVVHGIGKKKEGGSVSVSVDRQNDDLVIAVEDDGIGMDAARLAGLLQSGDDNHTSIGLRNVDSRLRMLYGPGYRLAIGSDPGKGTCVTIRIPMAKGNDKP
jgi:signal transduction histidine kinase